MRNLSISLVVIFLSIIIAKSCQDDTEICGEGTTPRLNIKFFDEATQTSVKQSGIFSSNDGEKREYVFSNQDSILLPLSHKISHKKKHDTLIYRLTEDAEQKDTIFLNFEPKEVFVSKGCGFKINYMNLKADLGENSNTIKRIVLEQVSDDNPINLTDEIQGHLFIYF